MPKKRQEESTTKRIWIGLLLLLGLFFVAILIAAIFSGSDRSFGANTAHIRLIGPLYGDAGGGIFADPVVSSTAVSGLLRQAADDKRIKAVLIEINSPGGSAVASDEIGRAIQDVRATGKPVIAWMREMGASGGYWVASNTDYIVANRMSITGSIGVYGSYLEFAEFIEEWNVTHNRLVSGERKDVGDPFQRLDPDSREYLQAKLDRVHWFFIEEIARNRNMSVDNLLPAADGSFYLGVEAHELGLIDELGGRDEALAWIEQQIGVKPTLEEFRTEKGIFATLFGARSPQAEVHTPLHYLAQRWIPQLR